MKFFIKNLFLVSCLLSLVAIPPANAGEIGISVNKDIFDLAVFAGSSQEGSFIVANPSEVVLPVHIELALWDLDENSDDIEFIRAEEALNATKWFTFSQEATVAGSDPATVGGGQDFILEPGEKRRVNFTINVPANALPRSYFVMARTQAVLPDFYFAEGAARTIPEVGILFFIKVSSLVLGGDTPDYAAEITKLDAKDVNPLPLSASFLPKAEAGVFESVVRKMTASIKNEGIYHFTTRGDIEIKNMFGNVIATAELPGKIMLPNRERSFEVEVIKDANFWQRNLRTGFYTATMELELPQGGGSVVKTTTFWVFPWKVISAIIILLFFVTEFRKRIFSAFKVLIKGEKIKS